jgi:undecaprenyl pyrophosphate phosphatase UppP
MFARAFLALNQDAGFVSNLEQNSIIGAICGHYFLVGVCSVMLWRSKQIRSKSGLAAVVMPYKSSRWWWFFLLVLHADLTIFITFQPYDIPTLAIVLIFLNLTLLGATRYFKPHLDRDGKQKLLKLTTASLVAQISVPFAALLLSQSESGAFRGFLDIVLSLVLIASVFYFVEHLRDEVAEVASVCSRFCCCCVPQLWRKSCSSSCSKWSTFTSVMVATQVTSLTGLLYPAQCIQKMTTKITELACTQAVTAKIRELRACIKARTTSTATTSSDSTITITTTTPPSSEGTAVHSNPMFEATEQPR